jgi:hypothetical protein
VQNLSDIRPGEGTPTGEGLSLVRRGAVRRPFLFMKADDDEQVAVDAETLALLAKEHGVDADAVAKAMADMADEENDGDEDDDYVAKCDEIASIEQPVYKRDFSADERRALAKKGWALPDGSYPIETRADIGPALTLARSGHGDTAAAKALIIRRAKALGATDLLPDDWKVSKEDDMSETATAVPVKKQDGSWDLTAVPEEARPEWEAILAKAEKADEIAAERDQLQKTADEALELAKAARDDQLTREYIAKAEQVGEDAEFGEVLKTIAGAVELETFEKLEAVLKANHERAVTAGLYEEIGKASTGDGTGSASAELAAKAEEIRKSDSTLTKEQAIVKAYEQNPDLYARVREEA